MTKTVTMLMRMMVMVMMVIMLIVTMLIIMMVIVLTVMMVIVKTMMMTAGIVTLSYGSVSDGRRAWKTRRKSRSGVFGLFATWLQTLSTTKSILLSEFPLCLKFSRLKAWTARSR